MAARTSADAVKLLMAPGGDYREGKDLAPFLATAAALIDRVVACAAEDGNPLTSTEAELLERWMAAHFYTKADRVTSSRSTLGASGAFVLDPAVPEPYKAAALELDPSGCLGRYLSKASARAAWLGKTESEQLSYEDRN